MSNIVATPIDLPIIEPDSWPVFWKIWNKHSARLQKVKHYNYNSTSPLGQDDLWIGMEIYSTPGSKPGWAGATVDLKKSLPLFYNRLVNLLIDGLVRILLIHSIRDFTPHRDTQIDTWTFRANLFFPGPVPQFYITAPDAEPLQENKKFMYLPEDTNWFAFDDSKCWHGSDFNSAYPKIMIQISTKSTSNNLELVNRSIEKYKKYTIAL